MTSRAILLHLKRILLREYEDTLLGCRAEASEQNREVGQTGRPGRVRSGQVWPACLCWNTSMSHAGQAATTLSLWGLFVGGWLASVLEWCPEKQSTWTWAWTFLPRRAGWYLGNLFWIKGESLGSWIQIQFGPHVDSRCSEGQSNFWNFHEVLTQTPTKMILESVLENAHHYHCESFQL